MEASEAVVFQWGWSGGKGILNEVLRSSGSSWGGLSVDNPLGPVEVLWAPCLLVGFSLECTSFCLWCSHVWFGGKHVIKVVLKGLAARKTSSWRKSWLSSDTPWNIGWIWQDPLCRGDGVHLSVKGNQIFLEDLRQRLQLTLIHSGAQEPKQWLGLAVARGRGVGLMKAPWDTSAFGGKVLSELALELCGPQLCSIPLHWSYHVVWLWGLEHLAGWVQAMSSDSRLVCTSRFIVLAPQDL